MDCIDIDIDPPKTIRKRQNTGASGPSHVHADGASIPGNPQPAARATRKSAWVSQVNPKKDTADLFARLGEGLRALAKTCEEIGESLE